MINELYKLAEAMEQAGISPDSSHDKYVPLPNLTATAPCVRITISDGKVLSLSFVDAKLAGTLRKYGSNQGTYPCMNLTSLYRITDDSVIKELDALRPEDLTDSRIQYLKRLCVSSNWDKNFKNKYRISFERVTAELKEMLPNYQPLQMLIEQSDYFLDPDKLYRQLEEAAFQMLSQKENVTLALTILFFCCGPTEKKTKNISVALETPALIDMGMPATSRKFVRELNRALLNVDTKQETQEDGVDAFSLPFIPIDDPMPEVKLAGGITVRLRTMFSGQPCQTRYGLIEGSSYPISKQMRARLKTALEWIGGPEQKHKTWVNTNKGEILFAYPSRFPEADVSFVDLYGGNENNDLSFIDIAKQFVSQLYRYNNHMESPDPGLIQIFVLRKIDNARAKVVYTRQTNPGNLEKCGVLWDAGCRNIPQFDFEAPSVPYPLDIAYILNQFWEANGTLATDKCRPIPKYYGVELLLNPLASTSDALHMLVQKAYMIGPFLGTKLPQKSARIQIVESAKNILSLMGCFLYRNGIRKDVYMEKLPYLYGQLLKASDELHMLYCKVVRNGNYPTQFVGSTTYQAALEAPVRTLNLLGQRMRPYISWAKTYSAKKAETAEEPGKERWRVKWVLSLYGSFADKLITELSDGIRFTDIDKAQFFLGYLASFPKKEKAEESNELYEEEQHEH